MSQRAHAEPRVRKLAAVAAVVALVVAVVAVIVVARRARVVDEDPRPGSQAAIADAGAGDPLIATITRLGATTWKVPPTTVDAWLAEPARIARGVTGARRVHDPDGLLLEGVRPGSPAAALGLRSDDVIRGINGAEVSDLAAVAPLIARSVDQVSLDLRRDGRTVILNYQIGR